MRTARFLFTAMICWAMRICWAIRPAKALIALLLLGTSVYACAQSCSSMSLGSNASLNGFVPFPATNVWNTNIASAPVDPNSAAITSAAGFAGLHLHPDFGSGNGIPYIVVDSAQTPLVPINVIDYASQSDVVVAPYPDAAPIEGDPADCSGWPDAYNGDAHVLVLDRAKCELYETYNTNHCNGQWDSSSETIWDMRNYESRPWGWTSADAAGLPIFPGLVRYDEVASGVIKHAIRFTMQQTKNDANGGYFVMPASHAAGTVWGVSNVMGMRIRLKASFDISGFSAVNQVILTAMKQYGMILADNGGYFFFQGVPDSRWNDSDLDNLKSIASSNFEVVQATPEFPGYDTATAPAGAAPTIQSFMASATTVSSGAPVTLSYSVSGDSYDFIDMAGPVAAGSGSVTLNPAATQTYILNATNAYGRAASAAITITVPGSVVAPPAFTPAAGSYSSPLQVTANTPTSPSATIHYTTDGSTPTTGSTVLHVSDPIVVSTSETLKAIATAPGYTAPSAVGAATYTIGAALADTPSFSLTPGTYSGAQTVTLTDGTANATIYYTTNGTAPTTGSAQYTNAITVASTETIEAMAAASGDSNSAIASATYTIQLPAAGFSVTVSPAPPALLTIQYGQGGSATVTVTPQNGFSSPVSFTCSGLPSGVTCSFSPATVTPSGAAASTTLTVTVPPMTTALNPGSRPMLPGAVLGAILCCIGWTKRRRWQWWLLLAVSCAGLSLLTACDQATMQAPPSAASKHVPSTVTVTAASGQLKNSTTFLLSID